MTIKLDHDILYQMTRLTPNLRIPGPTPIPDEVIKSLSRQMINHRGGQYEQMQERITENLKYFFQTNNDIFLLTGSGMGGLEAAVVNFFSKNDKLIFFTCGEFGNRWAEIGKRFGGNVIQIKTQAGMGVNSTRAERVLKENNDAAGVFITHNETSTGVINDIKSVASGVDRHKNKPLFLVDSISAMGAVNLPVDKLGIDVAVSASQKAWMAPPGIAMISVSERAWKRYGRANMPKYYFDLGMYREFAKKNQTPATPAVSTLFGLDRSLEMMKKKRPKSVFQRHSDLKDYFRKKINKTGLELFVNESHASPTLTSIKLPEKTDSHILLQILRDKYNTVIAGGMGETKGKIIRIAHMGYVNRRDLDQVTEALISAFKDMQTAGNS